MKGVCAWLRLESSVRFSEVGAQTANLRLKFAQPSAAQPKLKGGRVRSRHIAFVRPAKKLSLVPEDRQRDEKDGNDPKNDVFATAFFLGHSRQYTTSEIPVQVPIEFPVCDYGFAAVTASSTFVVNFTISRIWVACT
jgi:hypothetical protein